MHQDTRLDFQTIFNSLPGNFLVLQPNPPHFTILAISDDLLQLTNQERHNVVGKSVFEAYPGNPDDSTSSGPYRMRDYLEKTLQERKIAQVPLVRYDVPKAEGAFEARYWSADSRPVLDAAGNVAYILHAAIDITKQVTAQKQLEDQKGYLQSAVDIANLGTFKVDVATNTGAYSEAVKDWFGFNTLHKPMADIFSKIYPEDAERITTAIADSFQSEERSRHDITYRVVSSDQEHVRYLRSIGKALFAEGKPHAIIGIIQEVTPQVSLQQKLQESESRFRNLVKQAPVAIALTRGQEAVIESINTPMLRVMGKEKEEEVIGKKMVEALPEMKDQPILAIVKNVVETGEPFSGSEVPASLRVGEKLEQLYLNVSYSPLIEEGIVTGLIHVVIDVTEQVLARKRVEESEEELKLKNDQLVRINNDLDNFIYTASHDLKAPIFNIEGLLSLLSDEFSIGGVQEDESRQIVDRMQQSVERFKKTIESLTDVVKLQQENEEEIVLIELTAMIQEVRLDLKPFIEASGTQLEVNVEECPAIRFSEKNLRSVLYNLLSNAVKYRSPVREPHIQIHCGSTPSHHVLTVTDNGLGLEAGLTEELFTMFKRFHDHVEGTGIGLYMVKKMVENAGGRIEVESRLNEGTTFRIFFKK